VIPHSFKMTPSESCLQCGASLPSDAPAGLCPACLMSRGVSSRPGSSPRRWEPPGIEELQAILPQYEIVKMLGRGGMGAVYQARQISLDRPVAIKILSAELEDNDRDFAQRFKNEARAMGKLNHPGIVTVYDFGETADGLLYIVMEYVEGTDVARMIASQKRLHTAHAMAITAHVCDALAYAHERGIIHRDIKPANIMVGYDGVVKVADFGLAKLSADGQTSGLTQSGMLMGTMHYMAPETLTLGIGSVDRRADIYAVGVMLYKMLTGKLPQGMFELPSMQVAGLDPRYDQVIAKALREDREIRYQSAGEMRADLDGILTQPVVKVEAAAQTAPAALPTQARPQRPGGQPVRPILRGASPPPPKKKSRSGLILGSLGLLAALALAGFFVFRPQAPPQVSPSGVSPLRAATKEQPFVNTLGMKFVPVPVLGGPTGGQRVLFSVWDTRVQDYEAFVRKTKREWPKPDFDPAGAGPTHPAVMVSWEDAQLFCQWLTAHEQAAGRLPAEWRYRLPSDHEWSCAVELGAREDAAKPPSEKNGKINDVFPWGAQWPPPNGAGNYAGEELRPTVAAKKYVYVTGVIAGYSDGFVNTSPVGSFAANRFGLFDLGGNAWQWCEDWFDKDQKAPVMRGASWGLEDRDHLLSSHRNRVPPGVRYNDIGFRCVLAIATPASSTPAQAVTSAPATAAPPITVTKDAPFVNGLGMKFVPVPILGGPTGGQRVLFSVWDTRVQDYEAFVKETKREWPAAGFPQGPTDPAVNVSWEDAQLFCQWLTTRDQAAGRLPADWRYRLPSDHEWSCAVGIGDREDPAKLPSEKWGKIADSFPWGAPWPPPKGAGNYAGDELKPALAAGKFSYVKGVIAGYNDGFENTSPVGSFAANAVGLFDMGGNTTQWCEDWFDASHKDRVLRGTAWTARDRDVILSSFRHVGTPGTRAYYTGFRCVLAASVSNPPAAPMPIPTVSSATATTAAAVPIAATKDAPFVNTLGMKFVPVPIPGQPRGPEPVEGRVLFSVWDTRVEDYEVFVKETKRDWPKPDFEQGPTHPAVNVGWEDAQLFCQWLTVRDQAAGRLPADWRYRLPSDHEWSCAVEIGAREDAVKLPSEKNGKIDDVFPWGTQWPPPKGAGNYAGEELRAAQAAGKYPEIKDVIAGYDDGFVNTSPVGSFAANRFGLFDMGGNVWQWCEDWFDASHKDRVLRGASFCHRDRGVLLSSVRGRHGLGWLRNYDRGFRCVLASAASGSLAAATPIPTVSGATATTAAAAPIAATKDAPFVNTLGMKFVPVPILGGPTGGQSVLFSIWDTRVQDYEVFVKETKREWPNPNIPQGPTHPAVNVSWEDAQLFCQWLTLRDQAAGRLPADWRYRLPTDHEWSCAAEIGQNEDAAKLPAEKNMKINDMFPWGAQWPPPKGAGNYAGEELRPALAAGKYSNIKDVIAGYNDGYATTSPVGSFAPNRFGLHDMGGNVWQWCEDWIDKDQKRRVLRGSSWGNYQRNFLLSSNRNPFAPDGRHYHAGFRCVLSASGTKVGAGGASPSTLALSATPKPAVEIAKWLAQVDGLQQEAFQNQLLKPFEAGVADVRARYLAALDADIARASAAGQLSEALVFGAERQAFENAQNLAQDNAGTPAGVKALRASFRQQLAKLDQERTIKAKALHAQYDEILAKNQALLTQRQRLDDALLLKNKRDQIARVWLGPSSIVPVGAVTRDTEAFTPLFDGRTLDGWYGDTDKYQMRGGILISPPGIADIISEKEYSSFDLKFDVRLSAGANNGLGIWCAGGKGDRKRIQHTGYEIQIADDNTPEMAKYPAWAHHGSIWGFVPPLRDAMKPLGQWNAHEVIVRGTLVTVLVNGVKVQEADLASIQLQTDHRPPPDPGRRKGRLAFVGDTGTAEFRDARIREP
jgi:formylglycine-generating enzyme required for sulfatase activity/serine/threonine protein kinase